MRDSNFFIVVIAGGFLFALLAGPLIGSPPVASQSDLPTQATTTAYKLATVEARLDQCQEFHAAAFEAAWRWYGELSQCLGGTPTPGSDGP